MPPQISGWKVDDWNSVNQADQKVTPNAIENSTVVSAPRRQN